MLGLGGYESSDNEDAGSESHLAVAKASDEPLPKQVKNGSTNAVPPAPDSKGVSTAQVNGGAEELIVGPAAPPTAFDSHGLESASGSPYLTERALIRDLTMPPMPNLDIPRSPPGSPNLTANKKFKYFLDLKSQGTHFNEKLASSSSLKNPSLLSKLMDHAGIGDMEQYATSLPRDIWDPSNFPSWAFKEELLKTSQEMIRKEEERRARGQRDNIDFVPGTVSGDSSRGGTPGGGVKGLRVSAAERVMAGLSRESTKSPLSSDQGRNRDNRRPRERAPSPKRRKRSHSR